ncbi:MAG: hypothetical protein H0S85_06110 [Desulfovibrionaceae bacterium]|nr:hypothetical protein [Desulfovibrionaceae bacterium]
MKRPRLRSLFILLFFSSVAMLTGVLVWYNYTSSSKAALEMAGEVIRGVGDKVELKGRLLFGPIRDIVRTLPRQPGATRVPEGLDHPLLPCLRGSLQDEPQIYSVYFGYPDGGFFQLISLANQPDVATRLGAPEKAPMAARHILVRDGRRLETWYFLDAHGGVLGTTAPLPATYDPRTRPWYRDAADGESASWTLPYVFSSTGELGLTASRRVPGAEGVVFGVDLTLESLSRFLRAERPGLTGVAVLFEENGRLIAYQEPDEVAKEEIAPDGTRRLTPMTVPELRAPLARAAFRLFQDHGRHPVPMTRIDVDGEDVLCTVLPLVRLEGGTGFLALAARAADFTAPMAETRNRSLLFSLAVLVVGVLLLSLIAGRMSSKLTRLSIEADRIRNLEFDSTEIVRSHIAEVDRLGRAVAGMRAALQSFNRYLPKALVRQFINSGREPALGGEEREITLLFTDVENFTPFSETVTPEDLMAVMSEYFQAVSQAILDQGGTIDKYIGDAIMAFWNAPFASENHVEHACVAALLLSRASEELNERRAAADQPALRTRVGLHCGPAVVGNVGAADRMNYTALGATVNHASRMEGLNKFYGTHILASRTIRERAHKHFLFRSVDVVVAKGTRDPMLVFELVGAMPQSPYPEVAAPMARLGFCARWERAVTLYRTQQWDRALAEFTALQELAPDDHLAAMYCQRTRRLLENKPGRDWKAVRRFMEK